MLLLGIQEWVGNLTLGPLPTFFIAGLEKSLKDLSRQTVALQRVQVLLEEQLTKAEKAIKVAFLEVQKA